MALPKIQHPLFEVEIPSSKTKIKIRPMLVREEKILLIAKESGEDLDIFTAIKQVVNNCIVDDSIDIDELAIFDLEYLFLRIRAYSVDNNVKLSFRDNKDDEIYTFDVDLLTVKVEYPPKSDKKIMITKDTGVVMKYPPASLYNDKDFFSDSDVAAKMDLLIAKSIDTVFDGDSVYKASDYTKEELKEFIDDLDVTSFNKINEFLTYLPSMRHEITYKNKAGEDQKIVLSTLNDFFTLR